MGFSPIQAAFLQTDPMIFQEEAVLGLRHDDVEQAWKTAIAGMENLLYCYCQPKQAREPAPTGISETAVANAASNVPLIAPVQGIILSGPTSAIYQPALAAHFQSCLWTASHSSSGRQLLPGSEARTAIDTSAENTIPLLPSDPLLRDRFCLVLTRDFSWISALSYPQAGGSFFEVSFNPKTVEGVLAILRKRVQQQRPEKSAQFQQWLQEFPVLQPSYLWPMQFSRRVIEQSVRIEDPSIVVELEPVKGDLDDQYPQHSHQSSSSGDFGMSSAASSPSKDAADRLASFSAQKLDIELLKAIAHEIRTPLATIQTLTRLLIRRSDLPQDVVTRLESIQQECTQQIDRFSLIFRAIELTTTPSASLQQSLTAISLRQLLNQKMPRWESILERRSLKFRADLPETLPAIAIRDPNMLDQVLTGVIEQLSYTLPLGSQIALRVTIAGSQLKLQLRSALPDDQDISHTSKSMLKAVGQLLMLQPETGNLSLSLPATKKIFNFLGGKLTVRQTPPRGEVLTMFLPLDQLKSSAE